MRTKNRRGNEGVRLTVSFLATILTIILTAALCASGSRSVSGSVGVSAATEQEPSQYTWSPDKLAQFAAVTTDDASPESVAPSEDITAAESVTSEPVDSPTSAPAEGEYRDYAPRTPLEGETVVGEYFSNSVLLRISHVIRGDVSFFICDLTVADPNVLCTSFAGGKITGRAYTSKIAAGAGAVFAVNGDFCGFRNDGIIIRNGMLYRDKSSSWDLLYLDSSGNLRTCLNNSVNAQQLLSEGVSQTWCFGPALVVDYEAVQTVNTPGLSRSAREPRTAIGQVGELHYIILVVDAVRTGTSTVGGMSFNELAQTFVELGCKTAYNLDGGGSTTLYFKGSVINEPCVNGERSVSDIIYVK